MYKGKRLQHKRSPVAGRSLGIMFLGIGCITCATFGIWTLSGYSSEPTGSSYSIPAAVAAAPDKAAQDSASPEEFVHSTTILHPDKALSYEDTAQDADVKSQPALDLPAQDKILYPVCPAEGDKIGSLTIPDLNLTLPIIQGTGTNELKEGVGHFVQSVLPGEADNCVLSGHRETVFRKIGELKIGAKLIVQTSAGAFTYKVSGMRIVDKDDKTVIVPTDHAVLTMTTCYPFDTPGYFPDRYIVSANLVVSK